MPEVVEQQLRASASAGAVRPVRRTQAQRRAESEEKILRAARKLFGDRGYTSTTLDQIGREAGYSGGLVSLRFGSKEGVVDAIVSRVREEFWSERVQVVGVSGLARLDAILAAYRDLFRDDQDQETFRALLVLMAESLGPLKNKVESFREMNSSFLTAFEEAYRSAREAGEIASDIEPREAAFQLLASIRGSTLLWLLDPEQVDIYSELERIRRRAGSASVVAG